MSKGDDQNGIIIKDNGFGKSVKAENFSGELGSEALSSEACSG